MLLNIVTNRPESPLFYSQILPYLTVRFLLPMAQHWEKSKMNILFFIQKLFISHMSRIQLEFAFMDSAWSFLYFWKAGPHTLPFWSGVILTKIDMAKTMKQKIAWLRYMRRMSQRYKFLRQEAIFSINAMAVSRYNGLSSWWTKLHLFFAYQEHLNSYSWRIPFSTFALYSW